MAIVSWPTPGNVLKKTFDGIFCSKLATVPESIINKYRVAQKSRPKLQTVVLCPYLHQILTDFQNFFTSTFGGKFTIEWLLNTTTP